MNKPVVLVLLVSLFACLAASAQNTPASGVKRSPALRTAMPCAASTASSPNCPQGHDQSAQQLRMQQQMDRRSKAQQTMSNMMKKQADTQGAIASNVK